MKCRRLRGAAGTKNPVLLAAINLGRKHPNELWRDLARDLETLLCLELRDRDRRFDRKLAVGVTRIVTEHLEHPLRRLRQVIAHEGGR